MATWLALGGIQTDLPRVREARAHSIIWYESRMIDGTVANWPTYLALFCLTPTVRCPDHPCPREVCLYLVKA